MKAVVFDVGETLADETPYWSSVADRLGVPRFTFMGVFGGVVARGEHHHRTYELLGVDAVPGDVPAEPYPDALGCLERVRAAGYLVGVAGNMPWAEDLPAPDLVASAATLGAEKPALEFFERLSELAGMPPREIAYVGDRVDYDVEPALAAGMVAVHLRRGPWGHLHEPPPEAISIRSLDELPEALDG